MRTLGTKPKRRRDGTGKLTVVAAGDAAAGLAVLGGAGVLLQAGVGDAAGARGDRAVLVLATDQEGVRVAGHVADTLDVGDAGGGKGSEAEDHGGDGELHLE
jgi:hypothetical protein